MQPTTYPSNGPERNLEAPSQPRTFYGWWIVAASFLNLFFSVGIIYYGFPVFYPAFVRHLGFTHAEVTQGFLLGFLIVGIPFGLLAGALVDRIGARRVILWGVGFVGAPLVLMGFMTQFWQYELLCLAEVLGYSLAGPVANQVLITRWFRKRRGRAMGYAYLGLGIGGVTSPLLASFLIGAVGWRHALMITGVLILAILYPVGIFVTRSDPGEMGMVPDGEPAVAVGSDPVPSMPVRAAVQTASFWLLVVGTTLVMGAMNSVIQYFILFLKSIGYSTGGASDLLSILLASSLGGRVLVGYLADRFDRKNTMALFYFVLGASIPLMLVAHHPLAAWSFALVFGFVLGADYMLIPLVTAECFGTGSLGKVLALIIVLYTVGQWVAPWGTGKIFDFYQSYALAWKAMAAAGVLGAVAIYFISVPGLSSRSNPGSGCRQAGQC